MRVHQLILIFVIIILSTCTCGQKDSLRPNIILLLADDMGYADLGCYQGVSRTPNLDQLAANGIRMTDFYAAASNCSPSRAGLLTGIGPSKLGIYSYRPAAHPMHLRDECVTIAEVLKSQGYQTAHIGKWHLGCLPQDPLFNHPQPVDQGFDYSLGTENNAQPSHLNPVNFVRNGTAIEMMEGYSCQILADEAIGWLDHHWEDSHPFFLYLPFHEPHARVAAPEELIGNYTGFDRQDATYLACIENMDLAIGRLLDYLEKRKLMNNSFILFSSDNGSYRQASNGELRAVKSYVYEGGIRVPGIIHFPPLIPEARVVSEPLGFVDIMPTLCDLLDIPAPDPEILDGTSFLSLLEGKEWIRKKPLYWFFYRTTPEIAMRVGDLVILGKDHDTIPLSHQFSAPDMAYIRQMNLVSYELYDLTSDIGQDQNIMDQAENAMQYQQLLNDQLETIQVQGYHWDRLPEPRGTRKLKSDWRRYRR